MENDIWVSVRKACKIFGASPNTIRKWGDLGILECKRTPANHRIFRVSSYNNRNDQVSTKDSYIYVRVSSKKQENDLQRQQDFLHSKFPNHKIIKDIGSGLNYKRKGLLRLLDESCKRKSSRNRCFQ